MFTDYFNNLPESQKYSLLSAIRGPDSAENFTVLQRLKYKITFRIRHIVFSSYRMNMSSSYVSSLDQVDFRDILRHLSELRREENSFFYLGAHIHFLNHLNVAISSSKDHPVWGGYADKLEDCLLDPSKINLYLEELKQSI